MRFKCWKTWLRQNMNVVTAVVVEMWRLLLITNWFLLKLLLYKVLLPSVSLFKSECPLFHINIICEVRNIKKKLRKVFFFLLKIFVRNIKKNLCDAENYEDSNAKSTKQQWLHCLILHAKSMRNRSSTFLYTFRANILSFVSENFFRIAFELLFILLHIILNLKIHFNIYKVYKKNPDYIFNKSKKIHHQSGMIIGCQGFWRALNPGEF